MRMLKLFEEYKKEGIVRKVQPDFQRAKSLILESERKMRSLDKNLIKVGIDKDNANDYAEHCYDALLLLVRAKLYVEGFSASGQGAHEAEVSYLRNLDFGEKDISFMDELRYLRNGMLYYGKTVDSEYAEKAIEFARKVLPKLRAAIKPKNY